MKKVVISLFILFCCFSSVAQAIGVRKNGADNQNKNLFISQLIKKMTIDEKIGQLNLLMDINERCPDFIKKGQVGGFLMKGVDKIREFQQIAIENSRLKIPLIFGYDVIHGYETIFPIPLAMSCSWDMAAIENAARTAAIEASADGVCWTYSPMVDICHDPRWGRISEGAGEDPFLGSAVAKAMVKGYQEDLSSNTDIISCVKHFAFYGSPDGGLDYNTVDMSRVRMYNDYLAPYKAAIDAGVRSVMSSYNTVENIPSTGNHWLLTDLLRNQLGFKGLVVSDANAIEGMTIQGMGDMQHCSVLAMKAGVDFDMNSKGYIATLKKSLSEGKVTMSEIDRACRHVLEMKYDLGLFQNPYKYCDLNRPQKDIYTTEHRALARKIATESFVLLKNEGNILPLQKRGKIALIGPLANSNSNNMTGSWFWGDVKYASKYLSLLQGLQKAVGNKAEILYAKGSNLYGDASLEKIAVGGRNLGRDGRTDEELLNEAVKVASQCDVIVAALGEGANMCGESRCRSDLSLPDVQHQLLAKLLTLGKPVVMLNFCGRPVALSWEQKHVPAILNVWFGGSEAPDAIADVLFGDVNPSGKLTASFPQCTGQIPYFYNHFTTSSPLEKGKWFTDFTTSYMDVSNDMAFPFGYGLSYTTYKYENMQLSSPSLTSNGKIQAVVTVTNTGKYDGDEIVQMYIHDVVGSIVRPVKELKGFRRIHLKAGESKKVSFDIDKSLLKFYNSELKYVAEPGTFQVMIGPNSEDLQMKDFVLKDN